MYSNTGEAKKCKKCKLNAKDILDNHLLFSAGIFIHHSQAFYFRQDYLAYLYHLMVKRGISSGNKCIHKLYVCAKYARYI